MWGVGCILAELILREPLFPGEGSMEQFQLISNLVGKPAEELAERMYGEREQELLESLNLKKRESFRTKFRGVSK